MNRLIVEKLDDPIGLSAVSKKGIMRYFGHVIRSNEESLEKISRKTRKRLIKLLVFSVFPYAAETWTLKADAAPVRFVPGNGCYQYHGWCDKPTFQSLMKYKSQSG